ncbi:uncharacterized protein LOC129808918 [Phlebotomus papatasi]|uniref:uncharacterized protein LOC129808918 n=1 Tax=Phlebotomus papatasi TaxID=29031 RepID=UPI0024835067|nr:uncharacterized protein LOC129808918 [Phlebotomus papatasi]
MTSGSSRSNFTSSSTVLNSVPSTAPCTTSSVPSAEIPVLPTPSSSTSSSSLSPPMAEEMLHRENELENSQKGEGNDDITANHNEQLVEVLGREKSFNKKFSVTQLGVKFRIQRPSGVTNGFGWLHDAFQEVINMITAEGNIGDKAALELHLPEKPEVKAIYNGLTPIDELSADVLLSRFEKVNQSNASFGVADVLLITAAIVHMKQGRGRNKIVHMNSGEIRRFKKYSVIDPGAEEFCLPIAILFGRVLNMKNSERSKRTLLSWRRYSAKLRIQAVNLVKVCGGVINPKGEYDNNFISLFNTKFPKYLITVYNNVSDCKSITYKTQKTDLNSSNRINLFFNEKERHYFCISNVKSFFNFRKQCDVCDVLYNCDHRCPGRCTFCNREPPCPFVQFLKKCNDCNREFRGDQCYNYHKVNNTCNTFKICVTCDTFYKVTKSTEMSPLKEKPVRKNLDELIFESADNGVDTVDSDNQIDDDISPPEAEIYSDDTIDEDPEELIPAEEFNGLPTDVQQNFKKKANEYIRHSPSAKDVPSAIGILGEDGTVYHISTDIDFTKLFKEAQERQPVYSSKLTAGHYYRCEKFISGVNTFGQEVVIAILKNGYKIYLPKRLSDKVMPHCDELKPEDNWALKLVRYEEEEMVFNGVRKNTKTPILEIIKGVKEDGIPDGDGKNAAAVAEETGEKNSLEPLPGPSSSTDNNNSHNTITPQGPQPIRRKRELPSAKQRRDKVKRLLSKMQKKQMPHESQIDLFLSDSDGDVTFIPDLDAEVFEDEDVFTQRK